nr:hypothetical protein [Holospora elegans]
MKIICANSCRRYLMLLFGQFVMLSPPPFIGKHRISLCEERISDFQIIFCKMKSDGIAGGVALGITDCLDLRLPPPTDRPIAWFLSFFSASAVLMGAHNRGIDHRVPVIGVFYQRLKDFFPYAILALPRKAGYV